MSRCQSTGAARSLFSSDSSQRVTYPLLCTLLSSLPAAAPRPTRTPLAEMPQHQMSARSPACPLPCAPPTHLYGCDAQ